MARGTTLVNIRLMVLAEIGDALSSNTTRTAEINYLISNKQQWLGSEYDWPFLQDFFDVNIAPGQQYASLPTTNIGAGQTGSAAAVINFERPVSAQVFWNQVYDDMYYGIGSDEYNWMNNALGQQTDPIQRWRLATDASEPVAPNSFEVWPVPVTPQTVRFTAQRAIQPLAADLDQADLDDMLLVYFVAGEMLTRAKQMDASFKLGLAKQRLEKLRSAYPTRERDLVFGAGKKNWREQRRIVPMIIVAHGGGH